MKASLIAFWPVDPEGLDCGMTSARPFSPVIKFGGVSEKGLNYIRQLIDDEKMWE